MSFYLFNALLLSIALIVIAWAWLTARSQNNSDFYAQRATRNVDLYRVREAQLQQELANGLIEKSDFDPLYAELSRGLIVSVDRLEQLRRPEISGRNGSKSQPCLWLLLLVALPVMAVLTYQHTGAYQDWQISQSLLTLNNAQTAEMFTAQKNRLLPQINRRLERWPGHVDYRILLGQFAMQAKNYDEASLHYGILSELLSGDAQAHAYYAQALYLRDGREISADVAIAMDKALAIDPANTTILGMQGIDAFDKQEYQIAIDVWRQLLLLLPPQSSRRELIASGLNEARNRLKVNDEPVTSSEGIWLAVSLGENVPALDASTPVFIFAKALSGPKIPLAVKRVSYGQLPIKLQLNDSLSMTPQLKLSGFDNVIVGARVSLNGQAIASSGDWMTELTVKKLAQC